MNEKIIVSTVGKGSSGKTLTSVDIIAWYRSLGIEPVIFDFDGENTTKSGLQNYYPEAIKLDLHDNNSLDRLLDACSGEDSKVIFADLPSGAISTTAQFFDDVHEEICDLPIRFTSMVFVNKYDAGTIQTVLKYASFVEDRTRYIVVKNCPNQNRGEQVYWGDGDEQSDPYIKRFIELFSPRSIEMELRDADIQAEMRNWNITLQQIIDGDLPDGFANKFSTLIRAKGYQRRAYEAFSSVSELLIPEEA